MYLRKLTCNLVFLLIFWLLLKNDIRTNKWLFYEDKLPVSKLFTSYFGFCQTTALAQISFELQSKGVEDGSFVTLKGYEIDENEKYTYMFSNLGFYRIKIRNANRSENQIVIKVLDDKDKEVASNYNPDTKKYVHNFAFRCGKTGLYYLKFNLLTN